MKIDRRYLWPILLAGLIIMSAGVFLKIKASNRIHLLNHSLGVRVKEIVAEIYFLRNLSMIKNGLQYHASNAVEKIITEFINSRPELNISTIVIMNSNDELFSTATYQQNNLMLPWVKKNMLNIRDAANHHHSKNLKYGIFKETKSLFVLRTEIENDNISLGDLVFIVDLAKMKNDLLPEGIGLDFEIWDAKDKAIIEGDWLDTELKGVLLTVNNNYKTCVYELLENYWFLAIGLIGFTAMVLFIINRSVHSTIYISSNINMKASSMERLIRELDDTSRRDLAMYLQILHSNCQLIRAKRLNDRG